VPRLLARVVDGDEPAWSGLARCVHPAVLDICRRRRLGERLAARDDLHSEVAMRTLARMREDEFAALRRFLATTRDYPDTSFVRWLSTIVAHTFIDVLRAVPEFQRRRQDCERRLVELELVPLQEDRVVDGAAVRVDRAVEVRRIVGRLLDPAFPDDQRRALVCWLQGETADDIAQILSLGGASEANKLLHAARQRLRRMFEGRTS
jgi:DNA-directed RNA polymerase specialized sigma24 family protein